MEMGIFCTRLSNTHHNIINFFIFPLQWHADDYVLHCFIAILLHIPSSQLYPTFVYITPTRAIKTSFKSYARTLVHFRSNKVFQSLMLPVGRCDYLHSENISSFQNLAIYHPGSVKWINLAKTITHLFECSPFMPIIIYSKYLPFSLMC